MTGKGAALGGVAELWQNYRARLGVIGFLPASDSFVSE